MGNTLVCVSVLCHDIVTTIIVTIIILCAKPVTVPIQENKTGRGQGGNNSNGELTRRQVSGIEYTGMMF